ncbi:dihydrodipicolinate reductase-like protein CRR1, chloroplastic isoform X2 [Tanacetum coccineum]|uniref:Dihydrodipicolinate reductase-like protein CRR1, chloroplastic isoform X2 n=1 Tax=Tanacetum coccineum TaxID=301880 RepID=A0ABQ5F741_9ASTR
MQPPLHPNLTPIIALLISVADVTTAITTTISAAHINNKNFPQFHTLSVFYAIEVVEQASSIMLILELCVVDSVDVLYDGNIDWLCVDNGAAKEIGMAVVSAITKSRGMEVAGAVDSYLVGEDIGKVCGMEEALEIPIINDLTMVLGSISQGAFCSVPVKDIVSLLVMPIVCLLVQGEAIEDQFSKLLPCFHTDTRIGIIGAGPSGLSAAYTLCKLGYMNVTVLEKHHSVRGKSLFRLVVSKSCLKDLSLNIRVHNDDSLTLPNELFSSQNLITINVTNCIDIIPLRIGTNPVINCASLRVIDFECVIITQDIFHNLLSTCTLLEKIRLFCCEGLKNVKVKHLLRLRELDIESIEEDDFWEINNVLEWNGIRLILKMCNSKIVIMESGKL